MDNKQDERVYCPCCGKTETVRTVQYQVDKDEWEGFEDTESYQCAEDPHGVRVAIPAVEIEGGPWNGSRCLVEYQADHYECKACNKMFAVQC